MCRKEKTSFFDIPNKFPNSLDILQNDIKGKMEVHAIIRFRYKFNILTLDVKQYQCIKKVAMTNKDYSNLRRKHEMKYCKVIFQFYLQC